LNDERNVSAEWGIWSRYIDGLGRSVTVGEEVLGKVAQALASAGTTTGSGAWRPTFVLRRGETRLDHGGALAEAAAWDISCEGKAVASAEVVAGALQVPAELSVGIYELNARAPIAAAATAPSANLIVASGQAFQGPTGKTLRTWLIAVQLYGIRSRRNWGHGDFGDLAILLDCAAQCGAGGIGINPLHILFDDRPGHISPYSPNSRRFLDPLYIDVAAIPDFPGVSPLHLEAEIERLRACELVDYPGVRSLKLRALRACHAVFRSRADGSRRRDFEAFRSECGTALRRFASFETLRRRFNGPWWTWPPQWRAPSDADLAELFAASAEEVEFHEYLQWMADRQLARCRDKARQLGLSIGLYLDVAVGVVPDGGDAWSNQGAMLQGLSVGAPPDLLNVLGQSWGITTFSPTGLAANRFEPFRAMLSSAMRYAGAVRIDHVLGFNRLFVVPDGHPAIEGTYLDCPFEALLAITAVQSQEHKCIVIGEDLGTVPDDFRERLAKWGLWSYRVMQFERDWAGHFLPSQAYAPNALVTFTTHDLPTFAGWWHGIDMKVRQDIGLDPGETAEQRERSRVALREALSRDAPWTDGDCVAVARFLAGTPSHIVAIPLEDIVGSSDQPNIPGSIDEYPNWRMRPAIMIEDLAAHARLRDIAAVMREAGRSEPSAAV
jgi:4-alpha-glucanotransferase